MNNQKELYEIVSHFDIDGIVAAIEPMGAGFINDTLKVRTAGSSPDYILQRKNRNIFPDVPAMMENIVAVTGHIRRKVVEAGGDPAREVLNVVFTTDGLPYWRTPAGDYWTMCLFIDGSVTYDRADTPQLAYKGGEGIGKFQSQLADFNRPLAETIKGFHNIRWRFGQWDECLARDAAGRRASVARETISETRAKGYSIFYMMVNIGSFIGKSVIDPMRSVLGDMAYIHINLFSAILCVVALIAIALFYHSAHTDGEGKSVREVLHGLCKVFTNGRLLVLILIVTGFWMVQQQLYATMPKYVIRLAGETARPGWIANVNPLVVVLAVNIVTRFMARRKALTSITVGMFLIPLSALVMASGNLFHGDLLGFHPITVMMVAGIVLQALAECFISPRYLEYFSLQAPKGEEGLYLGFSHLDSFLSSILGFGMSGILLSHYCPDPALFPTHEAWQAAAANAHHIWYWFAAVGLLSARALILSAKFAQQSNSKN